MADAMYPARIMGLASLAQSTTSTPAKTPSPQLAMSRLLIVIGLICVAAGLLWPWLMRLGFGHLPGDFRFERDGFSFYFPLATSIVISVVLSLILWLINR